MRKTTAELYSSEFDLRDEEFQKIQEEAQQIAKFPIYYVDSAATVDQIKDTIQYFQDTLAKDKWLVVMLDHTLLVRGRSDESALNIIRDLQNCFINAKSRLHKYNSALTNEQEHRVS